MNKEIVVKDVVIKENIILIDYDISPNLERFFNMKNKFKVEYGENIEDIPEEIAIIPFISNVLPIIWLTDSTLKVKKLDKNYFNSIEKTKKAFEEMYKNVEWKGKIIVKDLIDVNKKIIKKEKTSIFFSGGIDSTSSLISVIDSKPILITIWGSDIWDNDELGWKKAKETVKKFGKDFKLENLYLKSNFRKFIKEQELNKEFQEKLNDSWWHGVQHGIGLIGHVAPYAYKYNITTHYIPATYTKEDKNITCASYPTIDESVKFENCKVIHEGFDKTRQQKIKNICNYVKNENKKINLRVCYMERGTKLNCCNCEKCYRTIMGILSEKQDPVQYGFKITDNTYTEIKNKILSNCLITNPTRKMWDEIIKNFKKDKKYWKKQKNIKWILNYNPYHKTIKERLGIEK